jgi:hypothetical protein
LGNGVLRARLAGYGTGLGAGSTELEFLFEFTGHELVVELTLSELNVEFASIEVDLDVTLNEGKVGGGISNGQSKDTAGLAGDHSSQNELGGELHVD